MRAGRALPALTWLLGASLAAQEPPRASRVEAGAFYHGVTGGFGDWRGAEARLVAAGARDVWYFEGRAQRAFFDDGVYGSVANTHVWSDRIYSHVGFGGGTGDLVLPDLRLDASLSVKLGRARRVVATAGLTAVNAKAGYEDLAVFGGLTVYAGPALVVELGGRVNRSDPASVTSGRVQGALTAGHPGRRTLLLRGSLGNEGYQLTGAAATLRRVDSQEGEAVYRHWLTPGLGIAVSGTLYHNPFYWRRGAGIAVFHAW